MNDNGRRCTYIYKHIYTFTVTVNRKPRVERESGMAEEYRRLCGNKRREQKSQRSCTAADESLTPHILFLPEEFEDIFPLEMVKCPSSSRTHANTYWNVSPMQMVQFCSSLPSIQSGMPLHLSFNS